MNRLIIALSASCLAIATCTVEGQQPVPVGAQSRNVYPAAQAAYFPGSTPPTAVYPAAVGHAPLASPMAQPASFACDAPCDAAVPCGSGAADCGLGGCQPMGNCGPGGCGLFSGIGNHLGGYDGYNSQLLGHAHGPYGSGGCCLPRAFDVQADWMFWTREDSESRPFTSRNILGPTVLDANQLDYDESSGFRVTGALVIAPATTFEATYFGAFNWADSAQVVGNSNLFSEFSNFGSEIFNGIADTGFANLHRLSMSSELDNVELNARRRWVSANCLVHSSLLVGARYVRFREDLHFFTSTDTGQMDYRVKADNDLIGAQLGGDVYLCVTPRFKIGAGAKAGVFGTANKQRTHVTSQNSPTVQENVRDNDVALVSDANITGLYRVTPSTTLRIGYEVMFVDGIASALDNFNSETPLTSRVATLNNDSDLLFHGATVGFECLW